MSWLTEVLFEPSAIQAVIVICVISAVGLALGRIKIFGISLGITFVFFAGILAGHFGIVINKEMLYFAQNLGLILFVYTLGLQVGPGFFGSLRKGGVTMNLLSLSVVFLGLLLVILFHYTTGEPISNMMGLFSGAVTNTPVLGAAQSALRQMQPENVKGVTDMALACAVAYPFGVVGVILGIVILRKTLTSQSATPPKEKEKRANVSEFAIVNPSVFNKSIREVMQLTHTHFVISRLWRDGKVIIPTSETLLQENDHLLIISGKADVEMIKALFGEHENIDWNNEDIDWNAVDRQLISRRIVVTQEKVNGVKLGKLRLRNLYGINITRVNRAGIDLIASRDLRLQIGDRLTVVGEATAIANVGKILGDEVTRLDHPNLLAVFVGISLGVLLGSIPIALPGISMPVRLGIAGGPIIVGILMGAFGPRFHLTTYTTQSANLMLRQFGIIIYLAGLGLDAGGHFFETVFRAEGLQWIAMGAALTIVPVLLVGFLAAKLFKFDYAENVGLLCGSMANPMALSYANTTVEGDEPSVAYATVYPLAMFVRVITAQIVVMFFL
ncbi:putative transporter [Parabacteroides sp. OttesenSCG-928-N08]|nr:putative transporter [Parabacteroides sp. OttesenSCG-928-N08]